MDILEKFINNPEAELPLNICILNVDYSESKSPLKECNLPSDPRPYLPKNLPWTWHMAYISKAKVHAQIQQLRKNKYDLYFNFCDGAIDEDRAGIEVTETLNYFNLPYIGCDSIFYELSKKSMKMICFASEINIPKYVLAYNESEIDHALKYVNTYPMIVKHHNGYSSIGLTKASKVYNYQQLKEEAKKIIDEYGGALIEQFLEGDEYTVLVFENPENILEPIILDPIQFVFKNGETFKHFELKSFSSQYLETKVVDDINLKEKLKEMAKKSWICMRGTGYGRVDIRANDKGELFFLEINSMPKIFGSKDQMSLADLIIQNDSIYSSEKVINHMIKTAFITYKKKQKPYYVAFRDLYGGLGVYAKKDIKVGELIHSEEELPKFLVSKKYASNYTGLLKDWFINYGYSLNENLFIIWSDQPGDWIPMNHSCEPNAWYAGDGSLRLVARRDIKKGEELMTDYSTFLSDVDLVFHCTCNEKSCRKKVTSHDFKLKELQEKYKTHFGLYIEKKIEALNNI